MNYPKFQTEMILHGNGLYHRIVEKLPKEESSQWFRERNLHPNHYYLGFIENIGSGIFFDGSLSIFPLKENSSFLLSSATEEIVMRTGMRNFIAIGYDGTTSGYFCIENEINSKAVFWFEKERNEFYLLHNDIYKWFENIPIELYKESIFNGYKDIKNIKKVAEVIKFRQKIKVEILSFDSKLTKMPDNENAPLPRYNKVTFLIFKSEWVPLTFYTVKIWRTGSSVGDDNVWYMPLYIKNIEIGVSTVIADYAFDPFNLPFAEIVLMDSINIDLNSKNRVRYKEIAEYL